MPEKVFLSYARDDLDAARDVERVLVAAGVKVWRDQGGLYGGAQWPKAIGEAIASSDMLLLAWSSRAARSHFVEFEWTTAIALKKIIIPYLLDDTPLPPALSAFHAVPCEDLQGALLAVVHAANVSDGRADPARESKVLEKLNAVHTVEPAEALRKAKAVFTQEGWILSGSAYTAGGNIIIKQRSWTEVTLILFALAAFTVVAVVLTLNNSRKASENVDNVRAANKGIENGNATGVSYFRGYVLDEDGKPIDEASVEIEELPGQTSAIVGKTTSDGDFQISNIPAAIGTRAVAVVTAPGFGQRRESVVLPGPKTFKLNRAR